MLIVKISYFVKVNHAFTISKVALTNLDLQWRTVDTDIAQFTNDKLQRV